MVMPVFHVPSSDARIEPTLLGPTIVGFLVVVAMHNLDAHDESNRALFWCMFARYKHMHADLTLVNVTDWGHWQHSTMGKGKERNMLVILYQSAIGVATR